MAARLSKRLHIARPIRLLRVRDGRRADGDRLAPAGRADAGERAGRAWRRSSSKRSSRTSSRTSVATTTSSTCCRRSSRRCSSIIRRSGGCRGRIRVERENCCDDLAVSLCGDPYAYARALADLEELRADSSRLVLAATGGSLLHRVRRLIGAPSHAGRGPGWLAGSTAVVLIAGIAAGAVGTNALGSRSSGRSPGGRPHAADDRHARARAGRAVTAGGAVWTGGAVRISADATCRCRWGFASGQRDVGRCGRGSGGERSRGRGGFPCHRIGVDG